MGHQSLHEPRQGKGKRLVGPDRKPSPLPSATSLDKKGLPGSWGGDEAVRRSEWEDHSLG